MNHFPTRAEIAAMRNRGMAAPLTEPKDGDWRFKPVADTLIAVNAGDTDPKACPHCGRKLGRGKHAHLKSCKGK